jgi:hypothetical protein
LIGKKAQQNEGDFMAIILCRECKNNVSSEARICPHCGIEKPGGKKKWWKLFYVQVGILLFLIYCFIQVVNNETENFQKSQNIDKISQKTIQKSVTPQFFIVHEKTGRRYDNGLLYYVLIKPVDLSSGKFKEEIKTIVKAIVSQKGNRISIRIYDDKETLELVFKKDTTLELLNEKDLKKRERHLIASYSGSLDPKVSPPSNALDFFPGAFRSTPIVGKYVDGMEFDASK